ncbi:RHS repeat-associated core domain-containing protein [uncultured Chryseobacterium sp.]|uniref:RHS repeat-associated core domain-containing protein n=1 Tax=uncultured Chryseobacterium sp. TaxID=259322 RepID=UPI003749CE73
MKMRLFSSFILSLCSVMAFSQTILYQAETSSRVVQDPQTVLLEQGFTATSDVSNPFVAQLGPATENPGGGPTNSNAGANNPFGTSAPSGKSFHDTKGNIEVNGAGQLQFTLPVALPPGIKDVAPRIDLVYTSGSGNGIAGHGWNISGLSAISRVGKTIEKDGEVRGVQLDYSDYYTFNGQRLILKSGEYGKDGAEYVTDKYSNIKVKSIGTISGQLWKGPEYWEVTFEDGSQAWYGATASGSNNARTPLEYNIVKWTDAQKNYITYSYLQSDNVAAISNIDWGGNETLATPNFNRIVFNYNRNITRNIKETSYVNGISFLQDKLLTDIIVQSNGNELKRYNVEYTTNGTNYQFASKIRESISQNDAANPIEFSYPAPVAASVDYYGVLPYNSDSFDDIKLTGDFNGDSYLDFIMNNGTVKLGAFNDNYQDISTGKVFNPEAKVVNTLLDEEGQIYNGNGIVQYEGGKIIGYIFRNNAFAKVFEKTLPQAICNSCNISLNEGDLNGDGMSDIFVRLSPQSGNGFVNQYIVDLKSVNNPVATYSTPFGFNESNYPNQKYLDVDGDGKVDIIDVSNTAYTIMEFVKISPTEYLKKIKYSGNLVETKDPDYPVLFGDFNGDGNLDFTIPTTDNQSTDNWRFYMGADNGFQNILKQNFLTYRKPSQPANLSVLDHHFYSISDINKDGKSDIILVYSKSTVGKVDNSGNAMWRSVRYTINTLQANGGTDFVPGLSSSSPSYDVPGGDYGLFQPLTNPIKSNNNYYDIFVFKKTRVHKYKAQTSVSELSRMTSISQGGVSTAITYKELNPDTNPNFYSKTKKEYYPYFSLARADNSFAVSQLVIGDRKQDFRYRGMTGHLQGKGIIGFHQTARSSWYANGLENTKIWSGAEIDALNEGLPVKEWSIRTNDENKIFPANISENNTELLSFKSTIYQTDKLLNGQVVTTVADADKPKIVTATVVKSNTTKDFLKGILTTGTISYGDYYLPTESVTNINNGYAVTTSTFEYIHNPAGIGVNYFIGRPKTKIDVIQAYGDTKSAKEEYIYENNLLKSLKKWNRDNSAYLQEVYTYNDFGSITQKTISNSTDSQVQILKTEYETRGRFVTKKTDNLNLVTAITYNDLGQVLTQVDPSGNILTNSYDSWGKLITSKSSLGGMTTYQYEKDSDANIKVTQNDPDGDVSIKYTDKLGRLYKASTKAMGQGQFVSQETLYDVLGRKINESEPYFEGQSPSQWNTIVYDDSVYPAKVTATAFNGKQIETTVSGLTTIVKEVNGYTRTTSRTTDFLGNIVSSSDKGGTITFGYNAAGEQVKSQYAENTVTTKYDVWGRKSEFNDPSNGTYKYEYDGFGQTKKIISPKGTKEYTYNNLGQLIVQKELSTADSGHSTNKLISFTYDDKGRLISRVGISKGKPYSSNILYDLQGRVLSTSENSNGKYFIQKGITYDNKGKVVSYEKQLFSSGTLTKVQIENNYSSWNGKLYQVKDKSSGKILWELQNTNAKGQVLTSKLGAANINNTYDANGFLSNVHHTSVAHTDILKIKYTFDAIRNELTYRKTEGDFGIEEKFDYDDNNRLINWTDPVTGIKPSSNRNVYDVKGRITQNDQVGTMKYENSAKIYQLTGMTLNAAGTQNYNNDLIQSVVYNENNDPVFIDGQKGDAAFQYGLNSMRQRVTYGGNFSLDGEGKFTKYYSEDASYEIVTDNTTGKEKHIIYVVGTPYESNIIYVKNFTENSGSYKFLHKDYLGSILAISDESGNKLEQRHYDAWGNFTHLQIGNGAIITDKNIIDNSSLLLDRGYTSHEHFSEVGIIHMNGRLYDPLLRRFLNADENIQDPYNTQNYNKYGYVLNNPLMFNDPSGEFIFFIPIVYWIAVNAAAIGAGALIGAAISIAMYTVQAAINNNFTLGSFLKAVVTGAVTGAVSGGIGQVFTAGGFWAAVGNGAISGAATGGVTSLITGTNFLKGLVTGAVIGGAVAGVTYTIGYFAKSGGNKTRVTVADESTTSKYKYDPTIGEDTMQNNVVKTRQNLKYTDYVEVGDETVGKAGWMDGTINPGNGTKVLAYTTKTNFWSGKSNIVYSPLVAQNPQYLVETMIHETGHALSNKLGLINQAIDWKNEFGVENKYIDALNTTEEFAVYKLEHITKRLNNWPESDFIPEFRFERMFEFLDPARQDLINKAYEKLMPVFNRYVK